MTQTTVLDPWFEAAKNGDITTLEQLLTSGTDINNKDNTEKTALHIATKQAQLETMTWLIEHGADLNAQDKWLSTSLHIAEKNVVQVRILLEAGADPNIKDKYYNDPYYFAFYGSLGKGLTDLYIKHGANLIYKKDM
ncbi:MAG: ankyrin repeat domain-containing protein [Ghiorsea sp.]